MNSTDKTSSSDETIGKLIASAGPGAKASAEAKARIYDAVHARWQSETSRQRGLHASRHFRVARHFRVIGIAATVALAAITVYWLQGPQTERSTEQAAAQFALIEGSVELLRADGSSQPAIADSIAVRIGDTLRSGSNGRAALRLNGDLVLRINHSSELVFSAPDAIELVAGTIYVDAGDGGTGNPLRVDTPFGEIEHVGTQYEVDVSGSALRIRVRDGAVAYTGATVSEIGQAGEQLDIDASGLAARSGVAPYDPVWEWATSLATLPQADEYRVNEVLEWVAREFGLTLDYSSFVVEQRLTNQTLVGLEGLNPRETLDVVQRMTDVATEISSDQLSIRN